MNACNIVRATAGMPRILHVSGDFPDQIDASKTPVVRSLVDLTGDRFLHEVVSLNRRSPGILAFGRGLIAGSGVPRLEIESKRFEYGHALVYKAPPRGLFHATILRHLGDWLADFSKPGHLPDLLIGHKLAIEGIAVRQAASRLGIPFSICIQGDTDTKVLAARPDLVSELAKVFHEAAVVFPFTPWALHQVEARLGPRTGPTTMLPCPTDLDVPMTPRIGGDGLVSVFHLKNQQRKNLRGMVAALRLLNQDEPPTKLAIIGGGSPKERNVCERIASGGDDIRFEGPLGRQALRQRLNQATGFVLPSLRESFGLAFIEALFAGLPVIYPRNTAIDGYFAGASFAIGVDAGSTSAISAAIGKLVRKEAALKSDLHEWQHSLAAQRFTRDAIGTRFAQGLCQSLGAPEKVLRS